MSKQRYRIIGDHPHKGDVVTIDSDENGKVEVLRVGTGLWPTKFESCIHGMSKPDGCYVEKKYLRPIGNEE